MKDKKTNRIICTLLMAALMAVPVLAENTASGENKTIKAQKSLLVEVAQNAVREIQAPILESEIVIQGLGTLILGGDQRHVSSIVINEGALILASADTLAADTCIIRPSYGVTVGFRYPLKQGDLRLFSSDMAPAFTLALASDSHENLDFRANAGLARASLGALGNVTYGGELTPHDSVYRFGGGGGTLKLVRELKALAAVMIGGYSAPYGRRIYYGGSLDGVVPPGPSGTVVLPASSKVPESLVIQNGVLKIGPKTVPPTPVNVSLLRLSAGRVQLSWPNVDLATACVVEMAENEGAFVEIRSVRAGQNTCVIEGLTGNRKLLFRVIGINDGLQSRPSHVVSVDTTPRELIAPELIAVKGSYRWVDLEWKNTQPECGTVIQQSADGRVFENVKEVRPGLTRAYVYIPTTRKVYFRVASLDEERKPGPWSNLLMAQTDAESDVERDLRHRFQLDDGSRAFNPNHPAALPAYTDTEKNEQRKRGDELIADFSKRMASGVTYKIPKGTYRVAGGCMNLIELQNVHVDAAGVTFILEAGKRKGQMLFNIAKCRNVSFEGPMILTTDIPRYSVARIVKSSPLNKTVDLECLPGYSCEFSEKENWYAFDDKGRQLGEIRYEGLSRSGARLVQLKNTIWEAAPNQFAAAPAADIPAFGAFNIGRGDNVNEHLLFKDITCYGFGAPAGSVKGSLSYINYRVLPQPGTSQLFCAWPGQFSGRDMSLLFDGCEFNTAGDDGINLLASSGMAAAQTGPRRVTLFRLKPVTGELLRFYNYRTLEFLGEARVMATELIKSPSLVAEGNHWLKTNRSGRNTFQEASLVTLDRDVRIGWYAQAYAPENGASELLVRNCYWRDMHAQAILGQAFRQGVIADNLFERNTQQAIELSASSYWQEGYWPNNVSIRNNVIRNNPTAPNRFSSPSIGVGVSPAISGYVMGLIENCEIEGNRIYDSGYSAIALYYGKDCKVLRNTIVNPGRFKDENSAAIDVRGGENVEIQENVIRFGDSGCRRWIRFSKDVKRENIRIGGNRILDAAGHEWPQGRQR